MKQPRSADLIAEAQCYLALVDLFRAEGCEPRWRSDYASDRAARLTREWLLIAKGGANDHP